MTTQKRPPKLAPADELFVQNMQTLRLERGLSQEALADEVRSRDVPGFNQVALSRIEAGTRALGLTEARTIADVLGTTVEQMVLPGGDAASAISALLYADMDYREGMEGLEKSLEKMVMSLDRANEAIEVVDRLNLDAMLPDQTVGRINSAMRSMQIVTGNHLLDRLRDAYANHRRYWM